MQMRYIPLVKDNCINTYHSILGYNHLRMQTRPPPWADATLASFPGAEEGGERAAGTHCLRMRLIATEFRGDRVRTCT